MLLFQSVIKKISRIRKWFWRERESSRGLRYHIPYHYLLENHFLKDGVEKGKGKGKGEQK